MKYKKEKESLNDFVKSLTDKQRKKIRDWNDDAGTFEIDESILSEKEKIRLQTILENFGYIED
jgi:predicted CopG family antitoxin